MRDSSRKSAAFMTAFVGAVVSAGTTGVSGTGTGAGATGGAMRAITGLAGRRVGAGVACKVGLPDAGRTGTEGVFAREAALAVVAGCTATGFGFTGSGTGVGAGAGGGGSGGFVAAM